MPLLSPYLARHLLVFRASQIFKTARGNYSTMATPPRETVRGYPRALELLNLLASNRTVTSMVGSNAADMNALAIPEMLDWLGKAGCNPDEFKKFKVVHVSGTKGKGSVCAMTSSILKQYGDIDFKVDHSDSSSPRRGLGRIGTYTSPHLVTPRERIRINGEPISKEMFEKYFFCLWNSFTVAAWEQGHLDPLSSDTKPGYFRFMTLMALRLFAEEQIRTVVMECGIGGEYDSTNILPKENITVAGITRLGIDHVAMLGDTIESIAWHKAGIMRSGVDVFSVPQMNEAIKILEERAQEKGAKLHVIERKDLRGVRLGLQGDFQKDNASLAVELAREHLLRMGLSGMLKGEDMPQPFIRGLEEVKWEGRCEVRSEPKIDWCIDGAHTTDSLEVTAKWFTEKIKNHEGPLYIIFNQQTRDAPELLKGLYASLEKFTGRKHVFEKAFLCTNDHYTNEDDNSPNLDVQNNTAAVSKESDPDCVASPMTSINTAMMEVRALSKDGNVAKVLVTGSLYLVGGFLAVLDGKKGPI